MIKKLITLLSFAPLALSDTNVTTKDLEVNDIVAPELSKDGWFWDDDHYDDYSDDYSDDDLSWGCWFIHGYNGVDCSNEYGETWCCDGASDYPYCSVEDRKCQNVDSGRDEPEDEPEDDLSWGCWFKFGDNGVDCSKGDYEWCCDGSSDFPVCGDKTNACVENDYFKKQKKNKKNKKDSKKVGLAIVIVIGIVGLSLITCIAVLILKCNKCCCFADKKTTTTVLPGGQSVMSDITEETTVTNEENV